MASIGRMLLTFGVVLAIIGIVFMTIDRIGLSKLPGDIIIRKGNFTFFFPIASSIIVTIILNLLFRLFNK